MNSWVEGGFEPADQEPVGGHLTKGVGAVLGQGKKAPGNVEEGNGPVHGQVGEEEHEGDLADDGADSVERLQLDELIAVETEVFFEAGHVGVVCGGELP